MNKKPIVIDYFTDVLCVWAYAARRKVDEIEKKFPIMSSLTIILFPFLVRQKRK